MVQDRWRKLNEPGVESGIDAGFERLIERASRDDVAMLWRNLRHSATSAALWANSRAATPKAVLRGTLAMRRARIRLAQGRQEEGWPLYQAPDQ